MRNDAAFEDLSLPFIDLHHQRFLIPQDKRILIEPVVLLVNELEIEVVDDASQNQLHLGICQTKQTSALVPSPL